MDKKRTADPSDGAIEFRDENGVKRIEIEFKDGRKHGKFKLWHEDGRPLLSDTIENGEPSGRARIHPRDDEKE